MSERIGEFTQAQPALADPKTIELYQPGLIEFDRDAGPDGIDVVGLPSGRHGNRHDRVRSETEGARGGIDSGADRAGLRPGRRGDIIGRRPLCGGAQLVHMGQRHDDGRKPSYQLGVGPAAEIIRSLCDQGRAPAASRRRPT